ncbi:polysaccharide biosynthesis C-terminal domain-containing protein, partial [Escherichia coli]
GGGGLVFCRSISLLIFKDDSYAYIVKIFAASIFFFSLNSFFISLLNGRGEYRKYIISNILGNIITLFLSSILIIFYHIDGALIALVTNQVFNLFATALLVKKTKWFKFKKYIAIKNFYYIKSIMHYSLMPIFAALIMPISLTVVRNFIISEAGWGDAGVWDALWKTSNVYLMLITLTLNIYLLPKLSSLFDSKLILQEILKTSAAVCIIMFCIAIIIFFFKDVLIRILFTDKFLRVSDFIMLQIIGDTLKMLSWIIAYYMLSKTRVKKYIFCESIQWGGFILLCFILSNENILERVMFAYITSQAVYFLTLVGLFIPEVKHENVKL